MWQEPGLTINKEKSDFSQHFINILGYNLKGRITQLDIEPNPLLSLSPPTDLSTLRRVIGMFAHYRKWISRFSEKIYALTYIQVLPLKDDEIKALRGT